MLVQLIHWNEKEARPCIERLEQAGYQVRFEVPAAGFMPRLRKDPPEAVVIDLTRLPSQGRDMGMAIRNAKATRRVPLVFVEGDAAKVKRFRQSLPDAVYTSWERIGPDLKKAIENPPADPIVPSSVLAGYSGTPLPKKLGIKAGSVVDLVGAPEDFEQTLGDLPEKARLRRRAQGECSLSLWFCRSRKDLESRLGRMVAHARYGPVWIAWPKKASGLQTDLTQQIVRESGLKAGLVDYKICAIDASWSGLLFALRKTGKGFTQRRQGAMKPAKD